MLRIRKLVLAIAAATALSSGMAHALGLGEITLKSAQNQPLDAEIELLDVNGLSAGELAPSLAPAEEFGKAGVERPAYLNDLTFTPVINPSGKSVLRVTSSQPLPAPMVKFLVQVMWPQGRLLRDYSVLLDASKFSPEAAQAAAATPAVTAPAQHTTVRRDTLWEIASRARQGGSVQQTMLAIQALNPDAFINGNINQLKTGQVLRLPDQQQVQSIAQGEAVKEVAEQYAAWRQGRRLGPSARQLDATRRSGTDAAPAAIARQDRLRLVSAEGKGAAGDQGLSDKLATTQENLDSSRREGEELKSRVADLQSQLDKLQRLIALKNDQLARLEAQGAQPSEPAIAAAPSAIDAQLQPAPGADNVVTPPPAAVDTAPVDEVPPADVAAEESASNTLDDVLGSPLMLAVIGSSALLVLLLLMLLLARKRRADQEAEKHMRMARALSEESDLSPDLELPQSSFDGLDIAPPTVKLEPGAVEVPFAAPVIAASAADALLAEAERSIAGGRLNHAAELLEPAVEQSPERSDLRLKLMEVYARQGDRDAFVGHERQLIATGQNHADVESLKQRFPAMAVVAAGAGVAAALALDEHYAEELLAEEAQPETPMDLDEDDLDAAFDLSLDDLEGLETPAVAEPEPEVAAVSTPEPVRDDLDFDGLFDEPTPAPAVEPEPEVAELSEPAPVVDDLDFDSLFDEQPAVAAVEPEPVIEPEPEMAEVSAPAPVVDELDFDSLFDEQMQGQAAEPAPEPEPEIVPVLEPEPEPEIAEVSEPAPVADDLDFDSLFEEHQQAQVVEPELEPVAAPVIEPVAEPEIEPAQVLPTLDDLAEFDLDVGGDAPLAASSEPLDIEAELAAFDRDLGLEADLPELELPDDFDLSLADEPLSAADARFASELDDVNAELDKLSQSFEQPSLEPHFTAEDAAATLSDDLDMGDEFDFMSGADEFATKLDLARAYIDMGDHDGARDILDEVVKDGGVSHKQEAEDLLSKLV